MDKQLYVYVDWPESKEFLAFVKFCPLVDLGIVSEGITLMVPVELYNLTIPQRHAKLYKSVGFECACDLCQVESEKDLLEN